MTYKLKNEKSVKKNSYTKTLEEQIFNVTCYTLKNILSPFFGYLHENGTKGASCRDKCLFRRILNTAEIYYYLILEWVYLKERSIVMFLVLSAVEELL